MSIQLFGIGANGDQVYECQLDKSYRHKAVVERIFQLPYVDSVIGIEGVQNIYQDGNSIRISFSPRFMFIKHREHKHKFPDKSEVEKVSELISASDVGERSLSFWVDKKCWRRGTDVSTHVVKEVNEKTGKLLITTGCSWSGWVSEKTFLKKWLVEKC